LDSPNAGASPDPFLDSQLGYSFSVYGYAVQGDSTLRGNTGGGGGVVTSTDATGDCGLRISLRCMLWHVDIPAALSHATGG